MSTTPTSVTVPGPAIPARALKIQSRLRMAATWALIKPYWKSEDRKAGLGLLTLVVALNLGIVYINVLLNEWNRVFYNALEQRDYASFKVLLLRFSWIAAFFIVAAISRQYYTMMLQMRWRTWMTGQFMGHWMGHQAYYRIEQTHTTDNPDQRISDDLRQFTDGALSLSLGLLNSVVTLLSFVGILWTVSGPISLALGGNEIVIPGYMVWFAAGYAVIGSLIAHLVGRPLIGLNFQQEQYEADFRFTLVRLRENSEPVALYRGEPTEQAGLRARFDRIRANWNQLMRYTRRLTFVSSGYAQFAIIFPILVAAPRYFAGKMTLGGLMQTSSAFGQVQGALSWFVDSYATLVGWKAAANRLIDFQEAIRVAERQDEAHTGVRDIEVEHTGEPQAGIRVDGLGLALPVRAQRGASVGQRPLVAPFSLSIAPGERWLVNGPSGCGKSVLFRALAGIWPYGSGTVTMPADARTLFLPQRSYLPIGTLADALAYPDAGTAHAAEALQAVLLQARLPQLVDQLDVFDNWSLRLSPGEQQRLAFARALLQKPRYLFLDEATSALDEETEGIMYRLMVEALPDAAIISIAHRSTVAAFHGRRLRYVPDDGAGAQDGQGGDAAVSYRVVCEA
ncbi:Inner membrane ABC transporter ATP-binding protein YddA [Cupriavidus yeoncheonensis]|uniref:Inner membrane ABC transporter ATP-binding protein YddA n=1 Tax=Cupriavidus yeoncheonensis TaxID=1462994 RepID=A0A916IW40_9BURK|nr:ABC transporter ATP-binding protein/permease [Cupriavidus yeoncheonensis]CAG2148725.1 Inner membrane ABC transporter ATP-binding protein YddA [Cupriavidus yeoncheonensis]